MNNDEIYNYAFNKMEQEFNGNWDGVDLKIKDCYIYLLGDVQNIEGMTNQ